MKHPAPYLVNPSMLRRSVYALISLCTLFSADVASAQQASNHETASEGRLWNIDSKPFTYRLGRRSGPLWSEPFTLGPNETRVFVAAESDQYVEYEGLRGYDRRGHVTIEYPQFEGVVRVNLPGRTFRGTLVPNWFHFRDAIGMSRWIQAPTVEDAHRIRESMMNQPTMTPAEIEKWKLTHRANWVYFDGGRRSLAEPVAVPVPIELPLPAPDAQP